jgi:hypothetical protein
MHLAFDALEDCHAKAAFLFVATTGLRKSEVLKAKQRQNRFPNSSGRSYAS